MLNFLRVWMRIITLPWYHSLPAVLGQDTLSKRMPGLCRPHSIHHNKFVSEVRIYNLYFGLFRGIFWPNLVTQNICSQPRARYFLSESHDYNLIATTSHMKSSACHSIMPLSSHLTSPYPCKRIELRMWHQLCKNEVVKRNIKKHKCTHLDIELVALSISESNIYMKSCYWHEQVGLQVAGSSFRGESLPGA